MLKNYIEKFKNTSFNDNITSKNNRAQSATNRPRGKNLNNLEDGFQRNFKVHNYKNDLNMNNDYKQYNDEYYPKPEPDGKHPYYYQPLQTSSYDSNRDYEKSQSANKIGHFFLEKSTKFHLENYLQNDIKSSYFDSFSDKGLKSMLNQFYSEIKKIRNLDVMLNRFLNLLTNKLKANCQRRSKENTGKKKVQNISHYGHRDNIIDNLPMKLESVKKNETLNNLDKMYINILLYIKFLYVKKK